MKIVAVIPARMGSSRFPGKHLKLRARFGWSLSNLAALLRMNLFTHRDLWAWLNAPFDTPVEQPQPEQLELTPSNSDSRRWQPGLSMATSAAITA